MFASQKNRHIKRPGGHRIKSAIAGFSLIEVLIACTVFSFGLAGFTALLLSSIIGSAEARRQGIAAMSAASLSEQIRLNPDALEHYLNPPEYVSRICTADNHCTPAQQADYDFRLWQLELADSIRNAQGMVCRDETPDDGTKGNSLCDDSGPLVIKIFWNNQSSDARSAATRHRFTLRIS